MKKKFLDILSFVFIVCLSSDTYSMEMIQVTGEMKIDHAIYSWQVEGKQKFCDFMKKRLASQQQNFTIPSVEDPEKSAIQIDSDGELFINQGRHVVVRNRYGETIIDTNENQGQFDSESLDESLDGEDVKRKAKKLQLGDSLTLTFSGHSKVSVTFDNIIKLVSGIDEFEHSVRLSQMVGSTLISGAMRNNWKEKDENKVGSNRARDKNVSCFCNIR